jgi:hypothetical protein
MMTEWDIVFAVGYVAYLALVAVLLALWWPK